MIEGISIGVIIGYMIGMFSEWSCHRQYCDCIQCSRWRSKLLKRAEKKSS